MSNTNENIQPDSDYMNKLVSRIKTAIKEKMKAEQEEAERKIKWDEYEFNNKVLPYLENAFIELASPFIEFHSEASTDYERNLYHLIVYHEERILNKGFNVVFLDGHVTILIPKNTNFQSD